MSRKIRVLVANRPRLLRELILELFAEEPDIEVVGEVTESNYENIGTVIAQTQPEFLILGQEKMEICPALCEELLHQHPQMKILAIADDQQSSVYYSANLHIRRTPLENSESAILNALRGGLAESRRTM